MTVSWWLLPVAACVSLGLTGVLRRYALARRLIDTPNARSSHDVDTPRGGGLAIVLAFLSGLVVFRLLDLVSLASFMALFGAGAWVAMIGFVDDHRHISARWRLIAHFVGAAWAILWLGGGPDISIAGVELGPGWMRSALALVYLVWVLNLYNFMDGIDAIASIETITVCIGGSLLYILGAPGNTDWLMPALLAAAAAGFLYWNYPPARIFMGDVGSGFLGITLGAFSIQAAWVAPSLFWAWAILLGVFVVDASVTLIRRILQGETFYEAHRSHAYQHASRRIGAHKPVSVAVGAINMLWLLPVASLVTLGYVDGFLGLVIAYLPLFGLAFCLKAGVREQPKAA